MVALLKDLPAKALHQVPKTYTYIIEHWVWSLVCTAFFAVLAFFINFTAAFFLAFTLVMLLTRLDNRISIVLAMFNMAVCPVLLAVGRKNDAGLIAVWAFYFLSIGVFLQLTEFWKEKWKSGRAGNIHMDGEIQGEMKTSVMKRAAVFLRENLISAIGYMIAATFAANFLNYLFNVISGRLLGPDGYGEFAALLSIFMILTVPTNSLQAMVAKKIAEYQQTDNMQAMREIAIKCLQICLTTAVIALVVFLVLGRPISKFLHIEHVTPIIACGITVAVTILAPVFYGVVQGLQLFIWLGSIMMAYAAGRFIFGWAFIKLGGGVSGALLGGAISSVLVILIAAWVIRRIFSQEHSAQQIRMRDIGRSFLPFIISGALFLILISADQIIVKRKFSSSIAGDYACAAFIGKIILYFPSSVAIVLFPKFVETHIAGGDIRGLLRRGIYIVMLGSLTLSAFFIAFPKFTVTKLYGAEFVGAASILWVICLAMSSYTIMNMFIYYFLAVEKTGFLLVSLIACVLLGIGAMYLFAVTSFQVALIQFVVGSLFVVAAFIYI
jgi:O-antigen/teichoic acid export membrane protein